MNLQDHTADRAGPMPFAARLLGFGALLLLPLLCFSAYGLWRDVERDRRDAGENVRLLALEAAGDGERELARARRLIAFLAARPEVQLLDSAACNTMLSSQLKLDPLLANAGVLDLDKRVICNAADLRTGRRMPIDDQGWWSEALASTEIVVTTPQVGPAARKPVIGLLQALRDPSGKPTAMLVVTLDLQALSRHWDRLQLPPGSVLTLLDQKGFAVARSQDPERWIGKDLSQTLDAFRRLQPSGTGEHVGPDGMRRVYSAVALGSTGWTALAGRPAEQVFAPARERLRQALAWASAALALALLLALLLARHLSAPLRQLQRSAAAVADGRRDQRADESVPGEFRSVAVEFNRMLDHLHEAERRAERMHGLYEALSRSNRALTRGRDKQELCREVCAACVDAGHALLASVWLRVGPHRLQMHASAGPVLAMYGRHDSELDLQDPEVARSPTGEAVLSGQAVVANDYLNDARTSRWQDMARQHNVRGVAVVPLQGQGGVEAVLVLHVAEAGWFDQPLLQLLSELADDLALGFDNIVRDAARAHAEAQLVHSRERFLRLFQAAPLPAAVFDHPQGRVLDANQAFVEGLGLSLEELRGQTLTELGLGLGPADIQRLHQRLTEQHGRLRQFEAAFRLRDGRVHEVQISAELIEFDGRQALLTLSADLTLRKRTESALRESLARFELAASTGHVWAWRPDSGLKPPTALLDLLGYADEEMGNQPGLWLPEVHAQDRGALLDALRLHVQERRPLELEFRMRGRDGREHWLHASGQAQWNEEGRLVQMAGIVFDVSEQRRVQDRLASREEQLGGIVETAMDAIVTVDSQQRIVVFNRAACQMFGVPAEAAIGSPLERFIPLPDRQAHAGHVLNFAATGASARRMGSGHSLLALRGNGDTFPIEASISLLGRGEQALMTAVVRDVTDARAAEQARAAQVAAEAASQTKSRMVSRVAHELRNPLNAMLGFMQLLEADPREPLTERQRQQLQLGQQAGWHLTHLIDDLLDVSRIEAGDLRMTLERVALQEVLAAALNIAGELGRRHDISLAPPPDCAGLHVQADPARLRQVLINLLSNATKYNRPGGEVRIELSHDADWVQLAVCDTGLGMSAEQVAHLFEPFNRLGREHSGIEGTGIGLVLVRQLVEAMGGRLSVQSELGAGTCMVIRLQLAAGSALALAAPPEPDKGPALSGRLLYIEDEPVNVLLVEQYLSRWPQVQLVQAGTGAEGLAQALALHPDLVLLDMHLPDMEGMAWLQRLRAEPAGAELKVVALSANASPDDVEDAMAAGLREYWTKPLDMASFGRRLQAYLRPAGKP